MTERLYYTDPYLRKFDATVRSVAERDGRSLVFLDKTAFYPTSGGQPFDTGTLGGVRVVEVIDQDDGDIAHVVESMSPGPKDPGARPQARRDLLDPAATVSGEIDWERRFDHMQQHTGQHVLSAAFDRLHKAPTVSFHLGADVSTIDLEREIDAAGIAAAVSAANLVVWEDRQVAVRFASKEEASQLPLRKESLREGTLRLIDVEGWDLSACGGTHVSRTGAIGVIAVTSWERFKGGQRLEFVCGGRALRRFEAMRDALSASTRLLSVLPEELPGAIERIQSEAKEQKRATSALQTELARFRAAEIAASAETVGERRMVLRAVDADAGSLKALAMAIASAPGFVVVLLSTTSPTLVVVARSQEQRVSAQQILSGLVAKFGGRGGGKPDLAQGGGLVGTSDRILAAARDLLLS